LCILGGMRILRIIEGWDCWVVGDGLGELWYIFIVFEMWLEGGVIQRGRDWIVFRELESRRLDIMHY